MAPSSFQAVSTVHRFVALSLLILISVGSGQIVSAQGDNPPGSATTSAAASTTAQQKAASESLFKSRVAPLLIKRCLACHGGDKAEGGYSIKTVGELLKAGDSEHDPLTAGKPEQSELFRRLTTQDASERMPAESEPLSAEEIADVRRWITESPSFNALTADKKLAEWIAADMRSERTSDTANHPIPITAVAISSDSKRIYASGYGEVIEWNIEARQTSRRIPVGAHRVTAIDLSPDDRQLLIAGGEPGERGAVVQVSLESDQPPRAVASFSDVVTGIAYSPDGKRAAVGGSDGSLLFIRTESGDVEERMTPHADVITALAWSADGTRLITSSRDRTARVFDTEKMELIASYDRHERAVGGVSWGEAGPTSLDETGRLRLWSGTDNDQSKAEQSGLPRFLQRYVSRGPGIFLPDKADVRHFRIESKKIDDGKDDKGNPKSKTVIRFSERPRLISKQPKWILSLDVSEELVVAGTEAGGLIIWNKKAAEEPQCVTVFGSVAK
ncbi:MAG: c-type cytochrome domain-containing protein [Pirellulales bacterium]